MTPLTWWVLLGTLFVHARIVPARIYEIENACAILCQAEKLLLLESNEEGNLAGKVGEYEGNDDDEEDVKEGKVMVLVEEDDEVEGGEKGIVVGEENYEVFHVTSQFVEGRRGGLQHRRRRRCRRRRRDGVVNDHNHNHHDYHDHHHHLSLNDYCLISNQIRLHCREFFINLRNRQGCNCRLISSSIRTKLIKDGTNINPKDSNKLSDLSLKREQQQQQQEKQEQFRRVLVVKEEEEEEEEIREENKRFLLATMKTMMRNPKELSTIKDYHYYLPIKMETNNQDLVSSAPDNPSNSDEIDWDLWCMAQCDIGHGGSACECDIIP